MDTIKIPSIPGPRVQLCYEPQPLGEGMARCDRKKGHGGRHTWELLATLSRLEFAGAPLGGMMTCPACYGNRDHGHEADCYLSAALKARP